MFITSSAYHGDDPVPERSQTNTPLHHEPWSRLLGQQDALSASPSSALFGARALGPKINASVREVSLTSVRVTPTHVSPNTLLTSAGPFGDTPTQGVESGA